MRMILKTLTLFTVSVTVSMSQIDISGMVKDSVTGLPLSGAVVHLYKHTYSDTTGTDGAFQLLGAITPVTTTSPDPVGVVPVKVGFGNRLEFQSATAQQVYAVAVNLHGRTIAIVYDDIIAPGKYCSPVPVFSPGYYLYIVEIGGCRYSMPFVVTGREQATPGIYSGITTSSLSKREVGRSASLSRSGYKKGGIADTIIVSTGGYFQKLVGVSEPILSGLTIKCRKYADSVTDIDGNSYHTVVIGTQTWMVENLKTTKYNDNTAIPLVPDDTSWVKLTTPAYCWYGNDSVTSKNTCGALYNWPAVGTGKLAPSGWHVPADTEWSLLTTYLGGEDVAGGKLKEAGLAHWLTPNGGATNETGFSALPGGYRSNYATYNLFGNFGYWWTSKASDTTSSWCRLIDKNYMNVFRITYNRNFAFSVRCVKN